MFQLISVRNQIIFIFIFSLTFSGSILYLTEELNQSQVSSLLQVARYSSVIPTILIVIVVCFWRFAPKFIQAMGFPYLGGTWSATLSYPKTTHTNKKAADILIFHNFFSIQIVLETKESISRTIISHPSIDNQYNEKSIHYIYETKRKDGQAGAGEKYKGCSNLIIEQGDEGELTIRADYFTEQLDGGSISAIRTEKWPFYKFWK